jgi:hypothetical protein
MSFGTKSLIIVLDHGYLLRRSKTTDTRNHGQHLCTVARHTTNQEASHLRLLNAECILLLDTSLVAIRLNRLSTQWRKLHLCSSSSSSHRHRSLFPIWTSSALYRMSCVQLTSIPLPSERFVVSLKATLVWIYRRVRQLSMPPSIALFWNRTNYFFYITSFFFAIVDYIVSPLFFLPSLYSFLGTTF